METMISPRWRTVFIVVAVPLFLAFPVWWGIDLYSQDMSHAVTNLLPPARGEALTLTPNDMPDITCSFVEWKDDPGMPMLAVICPPRNVFAPLHVYLKLSWLQPADVPLSARGIMASQQTPIKMRTNKSTAWVWLEVRERQGAMPHRTWVAFNGVVDMALLTLSPKR